MPSASSTARTPLQRMLQIHRKLQASAYPNCSSLARELGVSAKTVQRDLDYIRDQLHVPVDYDAKRHGYYYTEPVSSFPTIPTTDGEMLALFVAQKALAQYRGTPFEGPLANAFGKLTSVLGETITVDLNEVTEALSFHHTGEAVTDLKVFEKVTEGLRESRVLRFQYRKLNGTRADSRIVEPYHLASIDGQWYLFANDLARKDIRTFVVGRIQSVPLVGRRFERPDDFSLSERLMGSFGVFKGDGRFRVRIAFDRFAAQLVRERNWHGSQKVLEGSDGTLELQLELDALEEIERWVLSWGEHATVLAPRELKTRVRKALGAMRDAYAEAPAWFAELHEAAQARQPERLLQLVMAMDRPRDAPGQLQLRLGNR